MTPTPTPDELIARAEERLDASPKRKSLSAKIAEKVAQAVEAGDSRIVPPFRTLARVLRPLAVNREALRSVDLSLKSTFPAPVGKSSGPDFRRSTHAYRAYRRRRRLAASASRSRNR